LHPGALLGVDGLAVALGELFQAALARAALE
jgi:hypothetical protein